MAKPFSMVKRWLKRWRILLISRGFNLSTLGIQIRQANVRHRISFSNFSIYETRNFSSTARLDQISASNDVKIMRTAASCIRQPSKLPMTSTAGPQR